MTDIFSPEKRSKMMAGIRSKNTKPEMLIRHGLHAHGFRYRLHASNLPGKPDLVFPKYRAVIFVHGCFWHGHNCHLFKWPATRAEFWKQKINRNRVKDKESYAALQADSWRVCIVWECALKSKIKDSVILAGKVGEWLHGNQPFLEVKG